MFFFLREDGKSGKILRVVPEYLEPIEEPLPKSTNSSSEHKNGPYKVDL